MEKVYLTKEGLEKLKAELHELKFKRRPEVSQKVATAREHGDLKENAEYHAAREELSLVQTKIEQIQTRLAHAEVIRENDIKTDTVAILTSVSVSDIKRDKQMVYTLVSAEEADIKLNKISVASPIGQGLLGKKIGETAEIKIPAGIIHFKILDIKPALY